MKKYYVIILLLTLTIVFSSCKSWISSGNDAQAKNNLETRPTNDSNIVQNDIKTKEFTPSDCEFMEIKLEMDTEEVEKILGKPLKVKKEYWGYYDADVLVYIYEFGSILFEPLSDDTYIAGKITIERPDFKGPRNIMVGEKIKSALEKFPYKDGEIGSNGEKYVYGKFGENSGVIVYKDNKVVEVYYTYGDGYKSYGLAFEVENDLIKTVNVGVSID